MIIFKMQISSSKSADMRFRKKLLFVYPQILYLEDIIKPDTMCCGSEIQMRELYMQHFNVNISILTFQHPLITVFSNSRHIAVLGE